MIPIFQHHPQFINWVAVPKANGKTDKIPVGPSGFAIDVHNPANWLTQEEAQWHGASLGCGVGFVFTEADPYFFVDIDSAAIAGEWSPLAQQILTAFTGCAVEVSHSGQGLHIFGRGAYPDHKKKAAAYGLEFYTSGRFVALTGTGLTGSCEADGQAAVNWFVQSYFQPGTGGSATPADWTDTPCPEWCGPDDDRELLKRAKRSKSASATFGGKASFTDLYQCNVEKLAESYPTLNDTDPFGRSEAEAALASHLAFYTGKNCERIERIMSSSPLCDREKWRDREEYRRNTILGAVSVCRTVYNRPPPPDPVGSPNQGGTTPPGDGGIRAGSQFMDVHSQIAYFKGCVYVINRHRMFVPGNGLLKPDQFKATYGGYQFALAYEGKPTKSAFECFTESQMYNFPKAFGTCFRPECTPGSVVMDEGMSYVNTYFPVAVDRKAGDPTRFLQLLAKILPNEQDRTILLSYMAACVQHVGFKFQWAPLLQGTEGNGKTFLATAVSRAVGEKYSHFPNAADLAGNGSKFTGWLGEKLFIGIEDIFPDGRTEVQEALKPLITNRKVEIQHKGMDQYTGDNRANFMLFCNYKDAIQKTRKDRRYCVLYSAQQSPEDIRASGMGGRYFPDLYSWARDGGFAIITDYLFTYPIPEKYNPAGLCHRAPATTSTREAIDLSLGNAEQDILEAAEEGRTGFRGGWISSVALDALLREKRHKIPNNKRKDLLEGIGFYQKERMNSPSALDHGKRPMLYITGRGETAVSLLKLEPGHQTASAYINAQVEGVNVV